VSFPRPSPATHGRDTPTDTTGDFRPAFLRAVAGTCQKPVHGAPARTWRPEYAAPAGIVEATLDRAAAIARQETALDPRTTLDHGPATLHVPAR